jgi:CHAP domain./Cpl-7 lysozyme C-terminal domain.
MRDKIVQFAIGCVGIQEGDVHHKDIIDTYNNHTPLARGYKMTYKDAWCATFISYLAIKMGITNIIPTECGCERMIELFKKLGEWIENDAYVPEKGDIIFYDWQDSGKGDNKGWSDHVGIVEYCDGKSMRVIEGNKNDMVGRRIIAVDARYIRGYGVPKYQPSIEPKPQEPLPIQSMTAKEIAKEVIDGKWGNGDDRKKKLTDAGYNYAEVQTWVNCILNGTTIDEIAKAVIKGRYGNGDARKKALKRLGYDYQVIQTRVNAILRGN